VCVCVSVRERERDRTWIKFIQLRRESSNEVLWAR